jgi:hypothetical protein
MTSRPAMRIPIVAFAPIRGWANAVEDERLDRADASSEPSHHGHLYRARQPCDHGERDGDGAHEAAAGVITRALSRLRPAARG